MSIFSLPKKTIYGKVIPKNAFDKFTNSKQKKAFASQVKRIKWLHKLSTDTTNLPSSEIKEIQILEIELKEKSDLKDLLKIINKAIPYHLIFVLSFAEEVKLFTAAKHLHPTKINQAVIDCTFETDWLNNTTSQIDLALIDSLEQTYIEFCDQITGRKKTDRTYDSFVEQEVKISDLTLKIKRLKSKINLERQFNKKVALNMELNEWVRALEELKG